MPESQSHDGDSLNIAVQAKLSELLQNTSDQLPDENLWPVEISTSTEAKRVAKMFSECEIITIDATKKLALEFPDLPGLIRTDSTHLELFAESIGAGNVVLLETVDMERLTPREIPSIALREPFILKVIEKYGLEKGYKRLPPILVKVNEKGEYEIFDGNTRTFVAKKFNMTEIRAYVIRPTQKLVTHVSDSGSNNADLWTENIGNGLRRTNNP